MTARQDSGRADAIRMRLLRDQKLDRPTGQRAHWLTSMDVPAGDKAVQPSIAVVFTTDHGSRAKRRLQAPETYNLDQVLAEVNSVVTQMSSISARRAS